MSDEDYNEVYNESSKVLFKKSSSNRKSVSEREGRTSQDRPDSFPFDERLEYISPGPDQPYNSGSQDRPYAEEGSDVRNDNDRDYDYMSEEKVVYKRSSPDRNSLGRTHEGNSEEILEGRFEDRETRTSANKKYQYGNEDQSAVDGTQSRHLLRRNDSDYISDEKIRDRIHEWSQRTKPGRSFASSATESARNLRLGASNNNYFAVTKYEVDYTNRNYMRSKCNKNIGNHRYVVGKIPQWEIEYDNSYFQRSKVNPPKGLHRLPWAVKRKLVPDNDFLADSTGWEFEYGPEFRQVEGDYPFMPEERVMTNGAYRYYGVRRNNSDSDIKTKEKRPQIDLIKNELKSGAQFWQDDIPHNVELKDRRISRGGYRYHNTTRNANDFHPPDPAEIDYRTCRAAQISEAEEKEAQGKPFKHTVLKKAWHLQPKSEERMRYSTHLSLIPGEGDQTMYEGVSSRQTTMNLKKHPSIRSVFKSHRKNQMEKTSKKPSYTTNERNFVARDAWHKTKKHDAKTSQSRTSNLTDDEKVYYSMDNERRGEKADKKLPLDIEKRIQSIRREMSKHVVHDREKIKGRNIQVAKDRMTISAGDIESGRDLEKHSHHPQDHGQTSIDGYEKYTNENGNEIWVKTKETRSKLHHKGGG